MFIHLLKHFRYTRRNPAFRISMLVSLAVIVGVGLVFWQRADRLLTPLNTDSWFTQQQLATTRRLDDIGVADINDDSWLDIYSTNHGFEEILLVNNSRGEFTDGLSRLNQYAKKENKDRHGMAWADYDEDGKTDVFIVHGGMLGRMMELAPNFQDELLIQDDFGFREDRTAEVGIVKKGCSGRQVNWVDFDGDGRLDIYVVCGRGTPPGNLQPNQLYWQKTEDQFVEVAAKRGLDIPRQGAFAWLDADKDGDMDMFWADFFWFGKEEEVFQLYVNQSGQFEPRLVGKNYGGTNRLTISDYDADGDLDLFTASGRKEDLALLTNDNGTYEINDPKSVGLPTRGYAANWVDYDNDGLIDLHVLPDGIYRQRQDRSFEATHLLGDKSLFGSLNRYGPVFCTWFDADNDGSRDLLMVMPETPPMWWRIKESWIRIQRKLKINSDGLMGLQRFKKWRVMLYHNIGAENHWLQLRLIGPEGNRPAIGARVEVVTPNGVQLQQVGQAEGSLLSQGHYRLYFGLGQNPNVDSVRIFWSDGTLQEIENLESDRLVTLTYSPT